MSPSAPDQLREVAERNPRHIWIEPTSRCNARCTHCLHFYRQFGTDMPDGLYAKIREAVLDDVEFANLLGYGEPLMASTFSSIVEDCASRGIGMLTSTNGILLRHDVITSRLVRSDILLIVSIDGAGKETFEFVRPYVEWEKMLESLECLRRHAEEAGEERRMRLAFNFVAMKQNIADLPGIVRLASHYGAKEIYILPLGGEHCLEKMHGQSLVESPELVSRPFRKAMWLAVRHNVAMRIPPGFRDLVLDGTSHAGVRRWLARLFHGAELLLLKVLRDGVTSTARRVFNPAAHPPKVGVTYCMRPWDAAYFSADGAVFPCCILGQKLGDMNTQEWPEIWNGPLYRNLRRTIYSWNPSSVCRFCPQPGGIMGGNEKHYAHYFARFRREALPIDSPDIRWGKGVYDLEYVDGAPSHRWLSMRSTLSLPMRKGAKFLRVLINAHPAQVNPGLCRINGGAAESFDNTCTDLHFPLDQVREPMLEVVLEMEREYKLPPDQRGLALALRGFEYLS